jgi:cytochrome c oxidase assembly protein subunit 15
MVAETEKLQGPHKFAVATASITVLLLMAGALVTSNDAADSVPDWPLAYGRIIPPLVGGIRYEFAHRVFAATVTILTLVLAVWLARSGTRLARKLGWTALLLVIAQALLGALRVLRGHPAVTATMHATLAQIFFVTVVSLALITSAWWQNAVAFLDDRGSPGLRPLAATTTAAIFLQLILGAGFRHGAFGILPHLIGFVVVTFLIVWTCRFVRKRFGEVRDLRRWGILLQAFLGTQILLGIAAYWAVVQAMHATQPSMSYVIITVAHVLVGALTLASSVVLTLSCYRIIRPKAAIALRSAMEASRAGGTRAESTRA